MTVKDLKNILATHDDSDEVMYFDSEAGEDVHMISNWISFKRNNEWKVSPKEALKLKNLADETMNIKP